MIRPSPDVMVKSFLAFHRFQQNVFAVPLRIEQHADNLIRITFPSLVLEIEVVLADNMMDGWVLWRDLRWDWVFGRDVEPELHLGGVVCRFCKPEDQRVFRSPVALYIDHLFRPFLEWVNGTLAEASHLILHAYSWGPDGPGSTSARFWRPGDDPRHFYGAVAILPLRRALAAPAK